MTTCYLPNCENETDDSSGLCEACRQRSWLDHVRADVPPENVEFWAHREPDVWFWGKDELGERWFATPASAFDSGYPANFIGWERPSAPDAPAPPAPDDLAADLVAIIAAQHAEIAQLKADKVLLEQVIAQERSATGRLLCQN